MKANVDPSASQNCVCESTRSAAYGFVRIVEVCRGLGVWAEEILGPTWTLKTWKLHKRLCHAPLWAHTHSGQKRRLRDPLGFCVVPICFQRYCLASVVQ